MFHPFLMFQIFSVILWCNEQYYIFAGAIFVIAVLSVVSTLIETRKNLMSLAKMARYECDVKVTYRACLRYVCVQ